MKYSFTVVLLMALSVLGLAQSNTNGYPLGKQTRMRHSHDLHTAMGRIHLAMQASSRTGARMTQEGTSSPDWAFSLGTTAGMGDDQFPAMFVKTLGTPSCANDYVAFPISVVPGVGSQANLVAFYNVYSGTASSYCPNSVNQTPPTTNQTGPSVLFAYAVGTTKIATSPTLSLDGKKIAVIETGSPAVLHIITWAKQVGNPTNVTTSAIAPPSEVTLNVGAGGHGCSNANSAVTRSILYVDYDHDIGYMGDNQGRITRINNVFLGTPTIAYCTLISSAHSLGTPVWDSDTSSVVVEDGGTLYKLHAGVSSFTVDASLVLGTAGSIRESTYEDGWGFIYIWTNNDGAATPSNGMYQIKNDLTSSVEVKLGNTQSNPIWVGDFNGVYQSTGPTAAGARGFTWGYNVATAGVPTLNVVQFNGTTGVMNTTLLVSGDTKVNTTATTTGTVNNMLAWFDSHTSADTLYTSVSGGGRVSEWTLPITNNTAAPTTTVTGYTGGTSGVVSDGDTGTVVHQGSIYFGLASLSTKCNIGAVQQFCAVALTEPNLQ